MKSNIREKVYASKNYVVCPSDLYLICDNPLQQTILKVFIELQGDSEKFHIANGKLVQRCNVKHSSTIEKNIEVLVSRGYVMKKQGGGRLKGGERIANIYSIDIDKILTDIRHNLPPELLNGLAHKETTEAQRTAMGIQQMTKKGFKVVDDEGVVINAGTLNKDGD